MPGISQKLINRADKILTDLDALVVGPEVWYDDDAIGIGKVHKISGDVPRVEYPGYLIGYYHFETGWRTALRECRLITLEREDGKPYPYPLEIKRTIPALEAPPELRMAATPLFFRLVDREIRAAAERCPEIKAKYEAFLKTLPKFRRR